MRAIPRRCKTSIHAIPHKYIKSQMSILWYNTFMSIKSKAADSQIYRESMHDKFLIL